MLRRLSPARDSRVQPSSMLVDSPSLNPEPGTGAWSTRSSIARGGTPRAPLFGCDDPGLPANEKAWADDVNRPSTSGSQSITRSIKRPRHEESTSTERYTNRSRSRSPIDRHRTPRSQGDLKRPRQEGNPHPPNPVVPAAWGGPKHHSLPPPPGMIGDGDRYAQRQGPPPPMHRALPSPQREGRAGVREARGNHREWEHSRERGGGRLRWDEARAAQPRSPIRRHDRPSSFTERTDYTSEIHRKYKACMQYVLALRLVGCAIVSGA